MFPNLRAKLAQLPAEGLDKKLKYKDGKIAKESNDSDGDCPDACRCFS
jgi:hypothetical protein